MEHIHPSERNTMSLIEELRMDLNIVQNMLDAVKEILSILNEDHKELAPDAEFDATFALKNAEADYLITELEEKIETLENLIEDLESQDQEN